MFKKRNFGDAAGVVKRLFFLLIFCALPFLSNCYQRFEKFTIRATDEGIVFSHPAMEAAARDGNLCIFGEINISRRDAADNPQEEMWSLQNTESGFQTSTEPMKKPYILYGETLPQTQTLIEPKPLREGIYRVKGVVGIYNQKRELLNDLSFTNKFVLEKDASGKLIVSLVAEK